MAIRSKFQGKNANNCISKAVCRKMPLLLKCAQKITYLVFPQTFYPNFLIFLHRYICHICDIMQLWLQENGDQRWYAFVRSLIYSFPPYFVFVFTFSCLSSMSLHSPKQLYSMNNKHIESSLWYVKHSRQSCV